MAAKRKPDGNALAFRGPVAYVNESLHKVDALLHTTRQDLARRLREGASALDHRKRALALGARRSAGEGEQQSSTDAHRGVRKGFKQLRVRRDRDYMNEDAALDLFAAGNGRTGPANSEQAEVVAASSSRRESSGQPQEAERELGHSTRERKPHSLRHAVGNLQQKWARLASRVHEHLPRFGPPQLVKLPRGRFTFVTLRDPHTPEGEPVRPDSTLLSLEEMLRPFSGLSQLLAHRDFRTLDDFNRLINKAAEELEAMREDKLNDGRPLGPLQREALRRKRARAARRVRSSLREPGRHVAIYTTASLPWMTGTAVNPLLRAAYLAKDERRKVTLVIPWLAKSDQKAVFPSGVTFDSPEQQEAFVRRWAAQRTGGECGFAVRFYPGRYAAEKCSILPVGDPTTYITDEEADVAVLEEPEHLNWYHHGRRWTDKFRHVVGVIHTNYLDYAMREEDGEAKAKALAIMNQLVCRMHCHKVVKLSDAVQPLPRQTTAFVHGVPHSFIKVGEDKAHAAADGKPRFDHGAYFIGKAIWAKGYTELLDLMHKHTERGEKRLHIDCYGSGEDLDAMKAFAKRKDLDMAFHGGRDHLDASMHGYRVFVNPSTSDVVATTTAEALAMGKWVVVHDLPCNRFFSTFSNCLTYRTPEEFSRKLQHAMTRDPHPMRAEERQRLTWEAATERFLDVSELKGEEKSTRVSAAIDTLAFNLHNYLTGLEALRAVSGAGVNTRDNPINLKDFIPAESATGGFFDDKKRLLARAAKAAS